MSAIDTDAKCGCACHTTMPTMCDHCAIPTAEAEVDHCLPEAGDYDAGQHFCHECHEPWPCEVDRLRAENEALRAVTEWAKDAPHHDWCDARFNDPPPRRLDAGRPSYPCKCGRDALAALEADR